MKEINELFSKTRTPEEWKQRLYKRAEDEFKAHPVIARRTVSIIAAAALCAVSVTAMAASGIIDLGALFRSGFGDKISASKIDNGEYQQPVAYVSDEIITVGALAFVGDTADSYLLMEAKLADEYADTERLSLDVVVVDEKTEDISSYFRERYHGVLQKSENGDTAYVFNVKLPEHWVNSAIMNGSMVSVRITGIYLDNDDAAQSIDTDIRLDFEPESSIVAAENIVALDKDLERNGMKYTVDSFISADYRSRVRLEYFVPETEYCDIGGVTDMWYSGVVYGDKTFGIDLTNACEAPEATSPLRLTVDGNSIPYSGDFKAIQLYNLNEGAAEDFRITDHFIVEFNFEPFDFEGAESVIIEISKPDGTTEYISVK